MNLFINRGSGLKVSRSFFWLLVFTGLLSFLQSCATKQGSVSELLDRNKPQMALKRANKVLKKNPEDKFLVYNRGRAKMNLGQFKGAIADFTKSLKLNTDSDWSHWPFYRMGQVNRRRGKYSEAIDKFTSALKFNSGWKRALEAREATKTELKQIRKGESKLKDKKYEEAESHFEKEIEQHPDSIRANMGMGLVYLGKEKYKKANSYFDKVLSYDSDHTRAQRYKKLASEFSDSERSLQDDNLKSEMRSEAQNRFNGLIENEDGNITKSLGEVIDKLIQSSDMKGTLEFFDQAKQEYPKSGLPELSKGLILFREGNFLEADTVLTRAIQKNRTSGYIYLTRGLVNKGLGQYAEAIQDFSEANRDDKLNLNLRHKALVNRGIAKIFLRRYDSAFEDFEQSVDLIPSHPEQYFYLGFISETRGEYNQAEGYFTRAIEHDTDNVEYFDYRRKVRQWMGQTQKAIEDIEKIQQLLDEKRPALAYQLARLYAEQHRDASLGSPEERKALKSSVSNLRFCLRKEYVTDAVIERDKKLENIVTTSLYRNMIEDL